MDRHSSSNLKLNARFAGCVAALTTPTHHGNLFSSYGSQSKFKFAFAKLNEPLQFWRKDDTAVLASCNHEVHVVHRRISALSPASSW
jgi:hypothetical protein